MSFSFGPSSKAKYDTLHPKLQKICDEVIKYVDCTIIDGVRTKEQEAALVAAGKSTTMNSKHLPDANGKSRAVDISPYPIDWNDTERFAYFAGYMMMAAKSLGISLIWGCDWNSNFSTKDTTFKDYPHFQLADNEN